MSELQWRGDADQSTSEAFTAHFWGHEERGWRTGGDNRGEGGWKGALRVMRSVQFSGSVVSDSL